MPLSCLIPSRNWVISKHLVEDLENSRLTLLTMSPLSMGNNLLNKPKSIMRLSFPGEICQRLSFKALAWLHLTHPVFFGTSEDSLRSSLLMRLLADLHLFQRHPFPLYTGLVGKGISSFFVTLSNVFLLFKSSS